MGLRLRIWMPLAAVLIVLLSIALIFVYGVPVLRARLTDYAETQTFAQAAAAAEAVPGTTGAELGEQLDLYAKTTGGEILVVDTGGRVVARAGSAPGFEASREMLQTAAAGKRMSEKLGRLNVAVAPVVGAGSLAGGVVFASEEPESTAYQLFLRSGLEAAGVASILGGGLMLLLGTLLSRRVERLALGARSIEDGDLSHRIEPGFGDELGDLAETFNTMAARLEDAFANLERRVAERTAELKSERARLEAVLQQMPSGVIIAEAPSGKLVLGNEQVERIWRHPFRPADSIDDYPRHYQIFHPDGRPYRLEERPLSRSIKAGEVVKAEEIDFVRGDGTRGTMRLSSTPIRDREGRIIAGVAIFDDVTEHKRAEEALKESEERFRATFEQAAVGISHTAPGGRWLWFNQKMCDILGYVPEELVGLRFQDVTHPDDLEENLEQIRRLVAGEVEGFSMEKRYVQGDGTVIWGNLTASLVREPSGEPKYFIAVLEDISDRKRAEEEIKRLNEGLERRVRERTSQLEQERATLNAILNNLTEGVLAADGRERVVFANPAARSMLSLDGQGRLGELPDPWEDFDLAEAVARCAREEGGCIEARVQGRGRLLQVKLEHLPEFGDHRGGALVVVQDLSESRRLEARQQRFLANAAHELKTPITTILGAADLLLTEEEDDPEVRRRFLNHIFAEARRMQRLSETLLRLARVGWDLREPDIGVVDLDATAREVLWRMAPLAESAGVELSSSGAGRRVRADGEWLEQALMVIVSNAVKYSGRGGCVVLRLQPGLVAVEDNGEGIAEADLPHVFDRFYQGEESSGGFGLGLPICKELVERMGGGISIESKRGTGTTVRIELPEVESG